MNYVASEALLDGVQLALLDAHLQEHLHLTAESVSRWVKGRWGVCYVPSGMAAVLRRLGYVYKQPKLVPGKADASAQEAFLNVISVDTQLRLIWAGSGTGWRDPRRQGRRRGTHRDVFTACPGTPHRTRNLPAEC